MRDRSNIVLVVDDSPDTVRLLTEVLDGVGMKVTFALDGPTALRIASSLRPHVVLMDAVMPAMDGFDCCRRMKALTDFENVPVIFMTGLGEPGDAVRGFAAGGADYVTKPIDIDAMLGRIEVHLSNARKIESARMALDAMDHFLAAINAQGEIVWFTPRAYRLLQERLDSGTGVLRLPEDVIAWLASVPHDALTDAGLNKQPVFSTLNAALRISYIGLTQRGDMLLRISDESDRFFEHGARFNLSSREAEVLSWIVKGKSSRDIAAILALSPRTVGKHLQVIYSKLGVENRTAAAALILSNK